MHAQSSLRIVITSSKPKRKLIDPIVVEWRVESAQSPQLDAKILQYYLVRGEDCRSAEMVWSLDRGPKSAISCTRVRDPNDM